jgi:hypothetical protein
MSVIDKIKDVLPEKVNPEPAVKELSKNQNGALFIISMCVAVGLLVLVIYMAIHHSTVSRADMKREHAECQTQINALSRKLDSVQHINERLRDSIAEYHVLQRYNVIAGPKELIITKKAQAPSIPRRGNRK